jgi:hypothetical protein
VRRLGVCRRAPRDEVASQGHQAASEAAITSEVRGCRPINIVARLDADLLRRLQQQLADECEAALELRVRDVDQAADDGHHQQPRITIERQEHAHVWR